jgi:mRNA interferase MazF
VKRGDVYIAAPQGDYSKPRPVVIVQSDATIDLDSRIVCAITTFDEPAALLGLAVEPSDKNGLQHPSYVMVEKLLTIPTRRFGERIGQLDAETMANIGAGLAILLGLA